MRRLTWFGPHIYFWVGSWEPSDPASAGFSEGRQVWELRFEWTCFEGFMRRLTEIPWNWHHFAFALENCGIPMSDEIVISAATYTKTFWVAKRTLPNDLAQLRICYAKSWTRMLDEIWISTSFDLAVYELTWGTLGGTACMGQWVHGGAAAHFPKHVWIFSPLSWDSFARGGEASHKQFLD